MEHIPEELYYNIFKFFTADTLRNCLLVSKRFGMCLDNTFVWDKVYHNTIPSKFVNYGDLNYKTLLKTHLSLLRHTEWFKRKMFIEFMYNCIYIDTNDTNRSLSLCKLKYEFEKYSKGKFTTMPNGWYWDSLEDSEQCVRDKFMDMCEVCDYIICEYDGKYIHWNFPRDIEYIQGIQLKNQGVCIVNDCNTNTITRVPPG